MEKFFIVVFYVRLACLIRLGIFFLFLHLFTVYFLYFLFFFCVTRERVRKGIKQETAAFISAKPLHLQFNVPFCFLTQKKEQKRRARENYKRYSLKCLVLFFIIAPNGKKYKIFFRKITTCCVVKNHHLPSTNEKLMIFIWNRYTSRHTLDSGNNLQKK